MSPACTLLEQTLAEQDIRNAAALAAIRARESDIGVLQQLADAMAARGARVRPSVTTHPIGAQAECRLALWFSCTPQELDVALEWLNGAEIRITRIDGRDTGRMRTYQLALRSQIVMLNATLHDAPTPTPFERYFQPAAA